MLIYVGNVGPLVSPETISELFAEHGRVAEVAIATDPETGRSRGFAYVTMEDDAAAAIAVTALNGAELDGRSLVVNPARARSQRAAGAAR